MISDKKIFITGGAGFIGTRLAEKLSANNKIVIYDNFRRNSFKYFSDKIKLGNVKIVRGDILDKNLLEEILIEEKPHIIVHLAAIAGVDTVIRYPVDTLRTNIIGTYYLLEIIRALPYEIERFVNVSTSEVFGSFAYKVEETTSSSLAPVGEARWTYAISKLAGEHFAFSYFKSFGIKAVTVRPFNIYGPGQVGEGAIHVFITRALKKQDLIIHGDGDQIRSWCYVDDFIDGLLLSMEKEEAIGNVFNIGNPRSTITILMLAQLIKQLTESKSKIIHVEKKYVDVELRIPSIEKSKRLLGYNPKVHLVEGLIETIKWYRGVLE